MGMFTVHISSFFFLGGGAGGGSAPGGEKGPRSAVQRPDTERAPRERHNVLITTMTTFFLPFFSSWPVIVLESSRWTKEGKSECISDVATRGRANTGERCTDSQRILGRAPGHCVATFIPTRSTILRH